MLKSTMQSRRGNETYNFWHAAETTRRDRDVSRHPKSSRPRRDRDVQNFLRDETRPRRTSESSRPRQFKIASRDEMSEIETTSLMTCTPNTKHRPTA